MCAFCAFFVLLLVVLAVLKRSASISNFMVTRVSRNIILVMGRAMGAIPFSMYELLLYFAGIALAVGFIAIIVHLFKKRWVNSARIFMSLALAALIVGNVYFVSAGFSYNRYEEYYPTLDPNLTKAQTVAIADALIDDFNGLAESLSRDEKGTVIPPYNSDELSYRLQQEYFRLNGFDINPYTPRAKTIASSGLMSEMHIRGVFFAPFGEPNVNGLTPPSEMPFTMAHEMAHAKGIMREEDADSTALYITLTSKDPYIRYSAYSEYVVYFLDAVYRWEEIERDPLKTEHNRLCSKISPKITQEWKNNSEHWSKYYKLSGVINKINDLYLRIMGQEDGTAAYNPKGAGVTQKPDPDPSPNPNPDGGTGGGGGPVYITAPDFSETQKIFFQAYAEMTGGLLLNGGNAE